MLIVNHVNSAKFEFRVLQNVESPFIELVLSILAGILLKN
jgi:hypothetical protein